MFAIVEQLNVNITERHGKKKKKKKKEKKRQKKGQKNPYVGVFFLEALCGGAAPGLRQPGPGPQARRGGPEHPPQESGACCSPPHPHPQHFSISEHRNKKALR